MAKRKPAKTKRPSLRSKSKLSSKSYKNLEREARNARRRLKSFSERPDSDNYFVPNTDDYTLTALVNRILAGESTRSIMRELRNLTADKIKSGTPVTTTASGYRLKPSEKKKLTNAVVKANENIRNAQAKFSDFADILPSEFSLKTIMQDIVSAESIENKVKDLQVFVPENLIPTAVDDNGTAGTKAEYQYYRNVLERENKRREKKRKENDPWTNQGYFRQQDDYDSREINIDAIGSMEELKKRATTWDDPARIYRANLFLNNYESSLDLFAASLINTGFSNSVIQERIQYIKKIVQRMYFNEEAITYASTRMPQISIALISGPDAGGEIDFDEIYNDWLDLEEMFNLD